MIERMKIRITALLLIPLLSLSSAVVVAMARPQQPIPEEKKRAMHRLDPVDIFPEAQDRGRDRQRKTDERNAQDKKSTRQPPRTPSLSSGVTPAQSPSAAMSPTPVATPAVAVAAPASAPTADAAPRASLTSASTAISRPSDSAGAAPASNRDPLDQSRQQSGLSLPVLLGLFTLVLFTLVFAVLKLLRHLRGARADGVLIGEPVDEEIERASVDKS
jgi:hypothetical protein